MSIKSNIDEIRKHIPSHVKLVCVSKFHSIENIKEAINIGELAFGENKPQELAQKAESIAQNIEWHFIGNLQTNKVKTVVPIANLIHSISNDRLLKEIEKTAAKLEKITNILIELHVAQEEAKNGFSPEDAIEILNDDFKTKYPHIRVCGVMGMASFVDDTNVIRSEFKIIYNTFKILKETLFKDDEYFKEISMGMSSDYKIAIEEGSTIVRIGSSIFGERNY